MTIKKIIKEIGNLLESGPFLPGGIRSYLSTCGTPGCHCKDKMNPKKHGPYYKLSYAVAGEDSSMFIKNINSSDAEEMVERFKAVKHLLNLLALEYTHQLRKNGFDISMLPTIKFNSTQNNSEAQLTRQIHEESWKKKALLRQQALLTNKVKIRDLEKSRKEWKQKTAERNTEIAQLKKELAVAVTDLSEQKKTKKRQAMN